MIQKSCGCGDAFAHGFGVWSVVAGFTSGGIGVLLTWGSAPMIIWLGVGMILFGIDMIWMANK